MTPFIYFSSVKGRCVSFFLGYMCSVGLEAQSCQLSNEISLERTSSTVLLTLFFTALGLFLLLFRQSKYTYRHTLLSFSSYGCNLLNQQNHEFWFFSSRSESSEPWFFFRLAFSNFLIFPIFSTKIFYIWLVFLCFELLKS